MLVTDKKPLSERNLQILSSLSVREFGLIDSMRWIFLSKRYCSLLILLIKTGPFVR
nr:MAG TPA: hypothetical protein [Caudoviricetes sp.]